VTRGISAPLLRVEWREAGCATAWRV